MLLVAVATLIGLVVVVVALYREEPPGPPPSRRPDWDPLPDPTEVVRASFPLAFPGYDPVSVERHLDALTAAYADLWACAPAAARVRARERAAARLGLPGSDRPQPQAPGEHASSLNGVEPGDAEALRTEAALAQLAGASLAEDRERHLYSP